MGLTDRDYDEQRHELIQEMHRGCDRGRTYWMRWNSAATWRQVRYRGDPHYCWQAFGDILYSAKRPVDAHMPVQPPSGWQANRCDCGGTKAKTTHAHWCATQPAGFDPRTVRVTFAGLTINDEEQTR